MIYLYQLRVYISMSEIKKKFNSYTRGLKMRIKKTPYGEVWQKSNNEEFTNFYDHIQNNRPFLNKNFLDFFQKKQDIHTILEIGCGAGVYPIKFKSIFEDKKYTGIDFSNSAIEHCKKNSDFEFITGDFIKMKLTKKFDFVFSHEVIDHVYDIDTFLANMVKVCGKYAYVSAYRGFFPNLDEHNMEWDNRKGCYHNQLSVKKLKETLQKNGLSEHEFIIRSQETGRESDKKFSTVIEIHKKKNIS